MKTIRFINRDREIPTHPDELTEDQYIRILNLITAGLITPEDLLSALLDLKTDRRLLRQEHIDEFMDALSYVDGFFEKNEETGEIYVNLCTCRNLIPEYDGHHGPGDMLDGVTFGQFARCATAVATAPDKGEVPSEFPVTIAAILYGYDDEERVPMLLAIHSWIHFNSIMQTLATRPIIIDGREINFTILFGDGGSPRDDDNTGWSGVTMEVARSAVFGKVSEVEKSSVWDVLLYLYKCKFEYQRRKK